MTNTNPFVKVLVLGFVHIRLICLMVSEGAVLIFV